MTETNTRSSISAAPRRDLLLLAAACVLLGGTGVWHQSLGSRATANRGSLTAHADRGERLEELLEELRRWEAAVQVLIQCRDRVREIKARQGSPLSLWNRIMARFPSGEEVSLHRLDWEDGALTLQGTSLTPASAGMLLDHLAADSGFSQVELGALEQEGSTVRFTITARTGR